MTVLPGWLARGKSGQEVDEQVRQINMILSCDEHEKSPGGMVGRLVDVTPQTVLVRREWWVCMGWLE